MLASRGWSTVSADDVARRVVEPGTEGLRRIIESFGEEVLLADGTLDRARLGRRIFADKSDRLLLESILHPLIRQEAKLMLEREFQKNPNAPIVYEIPLFFESSQVYPEISKVVVVYTPRSISLERLQGRDKLTREEADQRLDAQLDVEDKKNRADYVITNTGSLEDLEAEVEQFHADILKEVREQQR
jgi:dephospho-CoA kinase